ncbi:uncharacterized protein LOC120273757 [Dioscorea cayenensis subsp. rotundata]|uniref:Uncharacterized protein LOC120273757 n=1 Tax=Dioscorea cayennensis subsp. rotundata TaxID=55577 RepID=A0AB40CBA4_DIOCR|nr:uncharacterized protein LOC120273757 [Dioscorea cayenensis subsp. rotundata]
MFKFSTSLKRPQLILSRSIVLLFPKLDHDSNTTFSANFFGKPPTFDQVKLILLSKWTDIGEVQIFDLPNGFLLIRCVSQAVMQRLLQDGPWTINGIIRQLTPWRPFFEPAFSKLNTTAIWVQLHNLPVELWHESKPLSKSFWVGDDEHRVFVIVLYERLPTFCYSCGMVGHGANACSRRPSPGNAGTTLPPRTSQGSAVDSVRSPNVGNETLGQASPHLDQSGQIVSSSSPPVAPDSEFGPWLIVSRRRGRGGNV